MKRGKIRRGKRKIPMTLKGLAKGYVASIEDKKALRVLIHSSTRTALSSFKVTRGQVKPRFFSSGCISGQLNMKPATT